MPAGDGTGPMGFGPMTGRGMGYCVAPNAPGAGVWLGREVGGYGYPAVVNPYYGFAPYGYGAMRAPGWGGRFAGWRGYGRGRGGRGRRRW